MNVTVRYLSYSGNTKKIADAIGQAAAFARGLLQAEDR